MDTSKLRVLRIGAVAAASLAAAPGWSQVGAAGSSAQPSSDYAQTCRETIERQGIWPALQDDFLLQCTAGERLDHNPPKRQNG